jgi:hypothetical protein
LRAAEYISEALMNTSCDQMKASLETQKEFHLSQEKLLKQRELCEEQKKLNYKQELLNKQIYKEKFGFYNNLSNNLNNNTNNCFNNSNESETEVNKIDKNSLELELYRVMEEQDSLLQFILTNKDNHLNKSQDLSEPQKDLQNFSSTSTESLYKSGTKKPKDDKTTIEELQTLNDKLKQLVFQLLGELEKSQKDNFVLQTENQKLKEENRKTRITETSTLELPPLEPPALLY